ncbi:uncharacterized protein C8Q71DRAFT_268065 [Rhodofomes roseus]|uniref:Uncharacterized protein n=1 Tax=Rhodofomes roseus TaxID=34475 RepID=A0ABQ8K5H1_9APHY|nr:uncharacterized protein C8Q71DRAFT_268065 [Rhodofomes roseus]KAH9832238.1 hypothetical protein C8Q71DRAFT_268065 [Rhodofomes roseus]
MPILTLLFSALILLAATFNGKDTLLHGFGKVQNAMDVAFQSFYLPVGSLRDWNYPRTPPGRSPDVFAIFGEGEYTAIEYLDWYLANGTSTVWSGDALHNVSTLEWFVEDDYKTSGPTGSALGLSLDSADGLDDASYLNLTDSRLRCYIDVENRPLPASPSSSTVGVASSTSSSKESSTSAPEPLTTQSASAGSETNKTARCFHGEDYVASATGTFALPTSVVDSSAALTGIVFGPSPVPTPAGPSPVLHSTVPSPTGPVASDNAEDSKHDDSGFVSFIFACLEAVRELLGLPQHKFYPVIVLPIPVLFGWWAEGRFEKDDGQNEEDDQDCEEAPEEQEQHERGPGEDKQLSFDAVLPSLAFDASFDLEAGGSLAAAAWAGADISPSPTF